MKAKRAASGHSPRFVGRALRLSFILLLATACQVAFGDFEFDLSKLSVSCQSGVARCKDGKMQICLNGSDWHLVHTCSSHDECNLNKMECGPCKAGSTQCNEAQPETCQDSKWIATMGMGPCASAALCQGGGDASTATCMPSGCPAAGELQCAGDRLQRCPPSLLAWEDVELCASAALCNVDEAKAQVAAHRFPTCLVPTCSPGQFNCDTGSPRPCNATRNGWGDALVACNGSCNAAKGDCSPCTPGASTCSGATLSTCGAEFTWSNVSCSSALSCNSAEMPGCEPQVCTPGEFHCNEYSTLERCRSDGGKWEFVEQCANGPLCNPQATRCEVPACPVAGAKRCNGDQYQKCPEGLTRWETTATCPLPGSCDPMLGCLPERCSEGTYRCNDVALEQCIQSTWTLTLTCATPALCDAAQHTCIAPTCARGERQCVGAILKRCKDEQNGWKELETCREKPVCSQVTKRCEAR